MRKRVEEDRKETEKYNNKKEQMDEDRGKKCSIPLVVILAKMSALHKVELQNAQTTDSTRQHIQVKVHMHLQPKSLLHPFIYSKHHVLNKVLEIASNN